jgi:hypothetical protein
MIDTLVGNLLDGVEGRLLDAGIILDHDNTAAFAGGKLGEFLGGYMCGITNCSNDNLRAPV